MERRSASLWSLKRSTLSATWSHQTSFGGFNVERFPNTSLPALTLAASAYRRDDRTGERMSLALRTALFEEGRDVSDRAELAAIANAVDPDPARRDAEQAVYDDWEEGRRPRGDRDRRTSSSTITTTSARRSPSSV